MGISRIILKRKQENERHYYPHHILKKHTYTQCNTLFLLCIVIKTFRKNKSEKLEKKLFFFLFFEKIVLSLPPPTREKIYFSVLYSRKHWHHPYFLLLDFVFLQIKM